MVPAPLSTGKKAAYSLVVAAVLWLLIELVCLGGLWALRRKGIEYEPARVQRLSDKHREIIAAHAGGAATYVVHDPELGWTLQPGGAKTIYRANRQGLRADREYAPEPPPGVVRIAAFGDSFTHGSDVANADTWVRALEDLSTGLEVMNFGVPGYGFGQAFLRYRREGGRYRPHVVLLGFMSENVHRDVNVFRPFYFGKSGMPLAKPRFALEGDRLVLIENPLPDLDDYRELLDRPEEVLPRLGEHDWFYQIESRRSRFDALPSVRLAHVFGERYLGEPIVRDGVYNTGSEAFRVTAATFDAFYREALANGSLPIVVLFPERKDLRVHREGGTVVYRPLLDDLRGRGYRTIDLLEAFERHGGNAPLRDLVVNHYTPRGNRIVARHLLDELARQGLTSPAGVAAALREERGRIQSR